MKTTHLSPWEQEECVIDRPTPQMLRHLNECAQCRGAVEGMQHSAAIFRGAAMEWSAESLAARPRQLLVAGGARRPVTALRWAIAAALPLVLMVLVFLGLHPGKRPIGPVAATNTASDAGKTDDALLEQVDEQLSVAVPASMESLTHLVSTESGNGAGADVGARGGKPIVQTN
jgi:predicted anti-sigma-YlaC factor YlaD